jgi:hypothetical protein
VSAAVKPVGLLARGDLTRALKELGPDARVTDASYGMRSKAQFRGDYDQGDEQPLIEQLARLLCHRGWEDSSSGIRAGTMYLRSCDDSRWIGQSSPPETIRVRVRGWGRARAISVAGGQRAAIRMEDYNTVRPQRALGNPAPAA